MIRNVFRVVAEPIEGMPSDATFNDVSMKEPLEFVIALLRHHRPDFDNLPVDEQVGLLEKTCDHISRFLDALQDLTKFLEYGTPKGLPKNIVKDISKKLRAAVLRDVYDYTSRRIGEELNIPPAPSDKDRHENQSARKMADEGTDLWEQAFGREAWQERVDFMRAEAKRWEPLSAKDKYIELLAEDAGISIDETRRIIKEAGFDKTLDELETAYERGDMRRALQIKLSDPRYNRPLDEWKQE